MADAKSKLGNLHAMGFVHGDSHAGNVIVGKNGQTTLVDMGSVRRASDAQTPEEMRTQVSVLP